jgi:pyrroline-5-carboxylate reductase
MIRMDGELLLVGCGRMGGALLEGWLGKGLSGDRIITVEPNEDAHEMFQSKGCRCVPSAGDLPAGFSPALVLFAVKPQVIDKVVPDYAVYVRDGTVFLSIAAGKGLAAFEAALGPEAAVVRAMPNTPAAVGAGMSVLVANARVSDAQKSLCESLLAAVGEVAWVDKEALLDAVTAVSGSGPAYVFHLVEAMAAAGTASGLPEQLAMRLARTTVIGAGELMRRSEETAEQLRRNVTSPGGTTQAALDELMSENGLGSLMNRAVRAAARRSRELAS